MNDYPTQTTKSAAASIAETMREALHGLPAALVIFDETMDVVFFNDAVATVLAGVPECAPSLRRLLETCATLDAGNVDEIVGIASQAVQTGATPSDVAVVDDTPSRRAFAVQVTAAGVQRWTITLRDVTQEHDAGRRALDLASRDPLTGLANRRLFSEHAAQAIQSGVTPPAWMMLVDLDRFKAVNDTLGHPMGDALLKLVGRRMSATLRVSDLVARLGGDEFGLLIKSCPDPEAATRLARRVIDIIGRPYLIDGHLVHVGASIGIGSIAGVEDHEHLFKRADLALYAAKQAGRNTFRFFEAEMDRRAHQRRAMEIDLRKAIALREFELHYQPQINLDQNVIVGFEALIRWRHPVRGLVPPGDFIALAEELGLIVPIGEWVLREACREAMRWPASISVAVNVSPLQFEKPEALIAAVDKVLKATKLPGRRLEIEITESAFLRGEGAVLQALHAIRAMGVRIAMDDFGTGYSSLSQLNSFPFDKIKIDRSFVSGRSQSPDRSAIVRAITALGVSLGMATIAEGVETSEELARIRANGCTSVQGYLFSKPVPTEGVADLIAQFAPAQSSPRAA